MPGFAATPRDLVRQKPYRDLTQQHKHIVLYIYLMAWSRGTEARAWNGDGVRIHAAEFLTSSRKIERATGVPKSTVSRFLSGKWSNFGSIRHVKAGTAPGTGCGTGGGTHTTTATTTISTTVQPENTGGIFSDGQIETPKKMTADDRRTDQAHLIWERFPVARGLIGLPKAKASIRAKAKGSSSTRLKIIKDALKGKRDGDGEVVEPARTVEEIGALLIGMAFDDFEERKFSFDINFALRQPDKFFGLASQNSHHLLPEEITWLKESGNWNPTPTPAKGAGASKRYGDAGRHDSNSTDGWGRPEPTGDDDEQRWDK